MGFSSYSPRGSNATTATKIVKSLLNFNYPFVQTVDIYDLSNLLSQKNLAGGDTLKANYFTLNDCDQVATFTALFDQYRITYIELTFRPNFNIAQMDQATTTYYGGIFTVIDDDDATAPASVAELRQFQSCEWHDSYKGFKMGFVPHIALAAYSGTFASYGNRAKQWIDCNSPAVQHYGLKIAIPHGDAGQNSVQTWTVIAKYYLEFKNVR